MKPRRPILRLRNAPSSGEMRTNAVSADAAASAFAASPGTAPGSPRQQARCRRGRLSGGCRAPLTWRERMAAEVRALTGGHVPAVFDPLRATGGSWMPFTVGIRDAFMACYPEANERRVRRLFARLADSDQYLRALAREGARRHDLDGCPLGPVSDTHRARTAQRLEARRAKGAKGGKA